MFQKVFNWIIYDTFVRVLFFIISLDAWGTWGELEGIKALNRSKYLSVDSMGTYVLMGIKQIQ